MLFPSRLVIVVMLLCMGVFFYLAWEKDASWAVYAIPFFVVAAGAFSLAPQIDWWWYARNPPDVDETIRNIFAAELPFYKTLEAGEQLKFRQRTALTMLSTEYIVPSQDEDRRVPEDLKALLAAHAVMVTWQKEKFLLDQYEKVVVYARSFPSPTYPALFHAAETHEEDGVILLSTERMLQAMMEPKTVFNATLYEFAKVFRLQYKLPNLALPNDIWQTIEKIGGLNQATIEEHLGLPQPLPEAILMSYAILFPQQFESVAPKLFDDVKSSLA
jgi:hypothetical protein